MSLNEPSLVGQAIKNGLIIALLLIPTAISIYVAIEVKSMDKTGHAANSDIICFNAELCVLEVHGIWYRIDGVIDMENTIPDEYRSPDTINETMDPAIPGLTSD
jgi:hypothetical protein